MSEQMGVFEVMYSCRAMRRLSSQPVPEETLMALVDAAGQAATGGNQQRGRWLIVRDAAQKQRLADLNRAASEAHVRRRLDAGEALPHHDGERRARMLKAVLWLAEHMQDIHALLVPCHEFDQPPDEAARAAAQASVFPAVQNLLLAARAYGLGAVLTTYALRDYAAFAGVLGLPDTVRAYALIPVGWPLGRFGPVTRMPAAAVTRFDRWR